MDTGYGIPPHPCEKCALIGKCGETDYNDCRKAAKYKMLFSKTAEKTGSYISNDPVIKEHIQDVIDFIAELIPMKEYLRNNKQLDFTGTNLNPSKLMIMLTKGIGYMIEHERESDDNITRIYFKGLVSQMPDLYMEYNSMEFSLKLKYGREVRQ